MRSDPASRGQSPSHEINHWGNMPFQCANVKNIVCPAICMSLPQKNWEIGLGPIVHPLKCYLTCNFEACESCITPFVAMKEWAEMGKCDRHAWEAVVLQSAEYVLLLCPLKNTKNNIDELSRIWFVISNSMAIAPRIYHERGETAFDGRPTWRRQRQSFSGFWEAPPMPFAICWKSNMQILFFTKNCVCLGLLLLFTVHRTKQETWLRALIFCNLMLVTPLTGKLAMDLQAFELPAKPFLRTIVDRHGQTIMDIVVTTCSINLRSQVLFRYVSLLCLLRVERVWYRRVMSCIWIWFELLNHHFACVDYIGHRCMQDFKAEAIDQHGKQHGVCREVCGWPKNADLRRFEGAWARNIDFWNPWFAIHPIRYTIIRAVLVCAIDWCMWRVSHVTFKTACEVVATVRVCPSLSPPLIWEVRSTTGSPSRWESGGIWCDVLVGCMAPGNFFKMRSRTINWSYVFLAEYLPYAYGLAIAIATQWKGQSVRASSLTTDQCANVTVNLDSPREPFECFIIGQTYSNKISPFIILVLVVAENGE